MKNGFIPQMEPWFGEEERIALNNYMKRHGWLTEFKQTQKFEQMICDYTGAKHCFTEKSSQLFLLLLNCPVDLN